MINSIQLHNIQSHKNTSLEFHPGVNIIVGSSDSGKTVILRALNWVINNKPSGDGLRRNESKESQVVLTVKDKSKLDIIRLKTNSRNEYQFDDQLFKAFGQGVPEEITKILNIIPLNFQQQMDPPFLLSATSGDVAQILNKAVTLEAIDRALANINHKHRNIQIDIKTESSRIKELTEDLTEYDHLPKIEKIINESETNNGILQKNKEAQNTLTNEIILHTSLIAKIADLSEFLKIKPLIQVLEEKAGEQRDTTMIHGDLQRVLLDIEKERREIKEFDDIAQAEQKVDQLTALDTKLIDCILKETKLDNLIHSIKDAEANIKEFNNITKANQEVGQLIEMSKTQKESKKNYTILDFLIKSIEKITKQIENQQADLYWYQTEFDKLMPEQCPLCGKDKNG